MKYRLALILNPFWLWLNNRCVYSGCDFPRYTRCFCKMHRWHQQRFVWFWRCDEIGLDLFATKWFSLQIGSWLDFNTYSYKTGWVLNIAGRRFDHSSFVTLDFKPL